MNGVPMKFDYSKTINEQLPTFNYYKDRYCSYELELMNDRKEIERLNNIINKGIEAINIYQNEKTLSVGYQDLKRIRGILKGNEFDLKMFEEYLEELKEENEFLRLSNPEMNIEHFRYVKENKRKIDNLRLVNKRLNNIINELKEWFKGYHKSYASCKWYEEDYIEFIEHLEEELKGSDKE